MNKTHSLIRTSALAAGLLAASSSVFAAEEIVHLGKGDKVPAVTVQNAEGKIVDLQAAVAEAPTVLIFYRGGWCPYCNAHLGELAEIDNELTEAGAQILAISPDQPSKLHDAPKRDSKPPYQLLSDHSMAAADAFGIGFQVDENHRLPHPAVFVASPDGTIHFAHVDANYKERLDPRKILAVGKKVAAMKPPAN